MERRTFLIGTGAAGLGLATGPRVFAQGNPEKPKLTLGVSGK
jgi:NitT/TauT family transport system substrate-binding protein